MPQSRGKETNICMFVDSDHAGDKETYRSISGFLIYINTDSIQWYAHKQSTVETSVFGAEFMAMKQDIDALKGLRYQHRMMGILISGLSYIYWDNVSGI